MEEGLGGDSGGRQLQAAKEGEMEEEGQGEGTEG